MGDHAFYVYNTEKLQLVYMSKFIENKITWIEATQDGFIYTALDDCTIVQWKKMHKVQVFSGHSSKIIKFLVTSELIFSLAENGEFIIFNIKSGQVVKKKQFDHEFETFMHPTTYVNKLLFSGDSHLELWNIIDDQLIYTFKNSIEGKEGIPITTITQSPVLHTVALGFADGEMRLINLQYD